MKRTLSFIIALVIFVVGVSSVEITKELYEKLSQSKNKIPSIPIPKFEKMVLKNDMVIYLAEDHELPVIELTGYIKGGRMHETATTAGITDFMFSMMNTGNKVMDEKAFIDYKALNGVSFGVSAKTDYNTFSGNALMIDADALLSVMRDTFISPDFNAAWFKRIKRNNIRGLEQAKTQDASLMSWYYGKTLYPNHPYSFDDDITLLANSYAEITPEKLQQYYDTTFAPNLIVMSIVGDFKIKEMKAKLKSYFETWPMNKIQIPDIKTPDISAHYGKIILVNKPDSTQAKIKMGYNFYGWDFKDRISFMMANRVYCGGGFDSRLMKNLRVEKGYVYSVYGDFNNMMNGGDYYVFTEVKPENAYETVQIVKDEMTAITSKTKNITDQELFEMVNLYNAQFPAYYKDVSTVLDNVVFNIEIRPRGKNYLNDYIKSFNQLNAPKVQESFIKHVHPDRFVTVIVGNKEAILPQFEAKGVKVDVIEIE